MPAILHLRRTLVVIPQPVICTSVAVRNYAGPSDLAAWLELRRRAFAGEAKSVGPWDAADCRREFLSKPWWKPERMWLAEAIAGGQVVGSATLGEHGPAENSEPAIHWLMVDPDWRRRGLGRLLVGLAESACWQQDRREIWLETHSAWTAAVKLYRQLGYAEPPPAR